MRRLRDNVSLRVERETPLAYYCGIKISDKITRDDTNDRTDVEVSPLFKEEANVKRQRFAAYLRQQVLYYRIACTLLSCVAICKFLVFHYTFSNQDIASVLQRQSSLRVSHITTTTSSSLKEGGAAIGSCAINLYGLPRKFKDLVLPSLIVNVLEPNAHYECDYYVHYYDRTEESDYRGADRGRAGIIDPEEVRLLTDAAQEAHASYFNGNNGRIPNVEFVKDSEDGFFQQHNPLLKKIYSARGDNGQLL
jgi:hypothetical protein